MRMPAAASPAKTNSQKNSYSRTTAAMTPRTTVVLSRRVTTLPRRMLSTRMAPPMRMSEGGEPGRAGGEEHGGHDEQQADAGGGPDFGDAAFVEGLLRLGRALVAEVVLGAAPVALLHLRREAFAGGELGA